MDKASEALIELAPTQLMDHDNRSAEENILRLEQKIFAAIQSKDLKSLDSLLADDFIHRAPDGSETHKPEFLQNIGAMPVEVTAIRGEHEKVSAFGDVAVLTGVQHANWRQGDAAGVSSVAFTDVFQLRGGSWLLVLAHGVDLPA